MFYEESQISNYLNCPRCHKRYDEPKILPCGKVICNTCINTFSGTYEFTCPFCHELHRIPDKGLPVCELRLNLLVNTPEEVYRGKNVEDLKQSLKKLITKTQELNKFLKNGVKHIQAYCTNLRLDVQHATETTIKQINQLKFSLIEKINMYEKKSIILFDINDLGRSLISDHFTSKFDDIEKFHNAWTNYLKKSKIQDDMIKKAIELAAQNLQDISEINMDEIILSKNVLKFVEKPLMEHALIEPGFLGDLKFHVDFDTLKRIEFKEVIPDLKDTEDLRMQNSFIDFIGDGLFFSAYQDKNQFLKFSILNDAKSMLCSYVHEHTLRLFNHFITNQVKNLVLIDYGYQGLFRIFNRNLEIIVEANLEGMELKGSNESEIYLTSNDQRKNSLHIYNWKFEFVRSIGQRDNVYEAFYIPTNEEKGIWQIDNRNNKYFWLNENTLHIVDDKSGHVLKTIQVQACKFIINSKNKLLVHDGDNKILIYDLDGVFINEIVFKNFSNCLTFDFILDVNDLVSFANLQEFTLYQLDNCYNLNILETPKDP